MFAAVAVLLGCLAGTLTWYYREHSKLVDLGIAVDPVQHATRSLPYVYVDASDYLARVQAIPDWLDRIATMLNYPEMVLATEIKVTSSEFGDADLQQLLALKSLKAIQLCDCKVSADVLDQLTRSGRIERIDTDGDHLALHLRD